MSIRKSIENRISKGENYLIIAVGDSVTWGLNHCSEEETYCAELARLFAKSMPEANVVKYDGIVKEERRPLYGYSEPKTVQSGSKGTLIRNTERMSFILIHQVGFRWSRRILCVGHKIIARHLTEILKEKYSL